MSSDYPFGKYEVYISTNSVGSEVSEIIDIADDFEEDVWNNLSEEDKEKHLDDCLDCLKANNLNQGYYFIEDEEGVEDDY